MVYAFEIIGLLFALIMIYLTYLEYKRKRISKFSFCVWSTIWIAGILLIIFHKYTNRILDPLNIIRVLDFYMILAFMLLFTLIFYLFLKNSITEKRMETLTRALAIKPLKNLKKTKGR